MPHLGALKEVRSHAKRASSYYYSAADTYTLLGGGVWCTRSPKTRHSQAERVPNWSHALSAHFVTRSGFLESVIQSFGQPFLTTGEPHGPCRIHHADEFNGCAEKELSSNARDHLKAKWGWCMLTKFQVLSQSNSRMHICIQGNHQKIPWRCNSQRTT